MKIAKISDHIGVEVTGIDLRRPVDAETRKRLKDAVVDNIAMVIRDQTFTPEEFFRAAQLFGEVMDQDHPKYSFPGLPAIKRHSSRNLDTGGNAVKEGIYWHTDGAYRERPPQFTILHAVELPDSGGDTNVVNLRAGYNALPAERRRQLDGMRTANVRLASLAKDGNYNNLAIMQQGGQVATTHPLVRTNADNGEKGLWFNPNTVEYIVGMDPEASQGFLYDLMDQVIVPEFTYSHKWRVGDVFMWDNRSSMHKVNFDYDRSQHRLHYHAMTLGERPF